MFGEIDRSLKPKKPQIFLVKPSTIKGVTIGKLNNYINLKSIVYNLGQLNEISFQVPYLIEDSLSHEMVRNKYVDEILDRYHIRVKIGNQEERFIINEIKDSMNENGDVKEVHAFSLAYELADDLVREYERIGYTIQMVGEEILTESLWAFGEIDPIFKNKYREINVSESTVLDLIFQLADTFGALVEFDTVNRLIHFRDPAKKVNQGFVVSFGKYLKTLSKSSHSDEMTTRLYVYGKDGLSINRINPTGTPYLEDFSYFMYPFERDENRNVIKKSRYMSDELCHAILDYQALIASKRGIFTNLLEQKNELQQQLFSLETQKSLLDIELMIIQDKLDVLRSTESFMYYYKELNDIEKFNFKLKPHAYYAIMVMSENPSDIMLKIDGSEISVDTEWKVVKKITDQEQVKFLISGIKSYIRLYLVEITEDEYNKSDNDFEIINAYNEHRKKEEIAVKENEINIKKQEISDIDYQINELKNELSIENNFTPELIQERAQYIIEKVWSDSNYINDEELYEDAKKVFLELKQPKAIVNLDIINFFEVLEEQVNWNKMQLGEEIRIRNKILGVDILARVTSINYNYENQSISITIANIKDILDEAKKLLEAIKKANSTSTTVDMSRYKWNEASRRAGEFVEFKNNPFDATNQRIIAGVDEVVDISRRGIIIKNPNIPNELLVMQSGVIALSKDGGENWQTAISPDGVHAERLKGKAIIGEQLEIGDREGTFSIKGNLLTVKDREEIIRLLLGEYESDKFGLKLYNKTGRDVVLDEDGILQTWQEGRADNVNPSNGLTLNVYLPYDTISVRRAILRFKLLPFRSYSATTQSGGSVVLTSNDGGGTTVSSNSGGGTNATSSNGGGVAKSTASGGSTTTTSGASSYVDGFVLTTTPVEGEYGIPAYENHRHRLNTIHLQHDHSVSIPAHTHNFDVPNHSHTVSIPNHSHTVQIPNHNHTVQIPPHTHEIAHDIYTSTTATGVGIIINGVNRTISLGGKFYSDQSDIDITRYMEIGQWNEIVLTSEVLGRIDATVFIQAFMGV